MKSALEEMKKSLARRYLGRAGIQGFGLDQSKNVIVIYISSNQKSNPELTDLLEQIAHEASPWSVIQKVEDVPRF